MIDDSKPPEQMAKEYSKFDAATDIGTDLGSYRQGLFEGFLAGYQAAKSEYEAKIRELETELDNWKHCAVYGDDGL